MERARTVNFEVKDVGRFHLRQPVCPTIDHTAQKNALPLYGKECVFVLTSRIQKESLLLLDLLNTDSLADAAEVVDEDEVLWRDRPHREIELRVDAFRMDGRQNVERQLAVLNVPSAG